MDDGGAKEGDGSDRGAEVNGAPGAEELLGSPRRAPGQKRRQWSGGASAGGRGSRSRCAPGMRRGGHPPGSSASTRRRRRILWVWPRQVRGSTRRRALSVSLPSKHRAGERAGQADAAAGGEEEEEDEEERSWHCRRPRPQPGWADARAGVVSAPSGGLGRAWLRGGDCRGPLPAPKEGGLGGLLGACEERHGGEAAEPGRPSVYREGGGARPASTTIRSPGRLHFPPGAGATGSVSSLVRRRKSSL